MAQIGLVVAAIAINIILGILLSPKQRLPKSDVRVPGSDYNRNLPKVFGVGRVEGNIIWPQDEDGAFSREIEGGKNSKKEVIYGTWAVALAEGPCRIKEIYLSGEVKYNPDSDDDETVEASFKFFNKHCEFFSGSNTQPAWSQMQSVDGIDRTPAYRAISYLGIEDKDISEYGNTFASISCVVEDLTFNHSGKPKLSEIIEYICNKAGLSSDRIDISEIEDVEVTGFIMQQGGESYREAAIEQLMIAYSFFPTELPDGKIHWRKIARPVGSEIIIPVEVLAAREYGSGDRSDNIIEEITSALELPSKLTLSFYDPALNYDRNSITVDYQAESNNQNEEKFDLQAVLTEGEAKTLAHRLLQQIWTRRYKYSFTLPPSYLGQVAPGDVLLLPLRGTLIPVQLAKVEIGANFVLDCLSVLYDATPFSWTIDIDSDRRDNTIKDPAAVPATPFLLELPTIDDSDENFGIYATADKASYLYVSYNFGTTYTQLWRFFSSGTVGACNTTLPSSRYDVTDRVSRLEVTLVDNGKTLSSVPTADFQAQLQLAFVGRQISGVWQGEVIAFQNAELIAPNQYRLSTFYRGLRNTESFVGSHIADETFILLRSPSYLIDRIPGTYNELGVTLTFKCAIDSTFTYENLEDLPEYSLTPTGERAKCWNPVHLRLARDTSDNLHLSWVRRARKFGRWVSDGVAPPLIESTEQYYLEILNGTSVVRSITLNQSNYTYPSFSQIADFGSLQDSLSVKIWQRSDFVNPGRIAAQIVNVSKVLV